MNLPAPLTSRLWILALIAALSFTVWINLARVQRLQYVTGVAREDIELTAGSPTGYAGGVRQLIVPEHIGETYQWIAQTQQMLAQHDWRVNHIDYENAPHGRQVHTASPYRWWLGTLATIDHVITRKPVGFAVERAALYADPLLQVLLLISITWFVARQFGSWPATVVALSAAILFPFAAGFLPGTVDDFSLLLVCAPWSVLPLLLGLRSLKAPAFATASSRVTTQSWFVLAGIFCGLGLWISVPVQLPVVLGIALGGILAAWVQRSEGQDENARELTLRQWRAWSLGGAGTVLAAYLIEYFPGQLGTWELRVVHPLYGLAWLGIGELLARAALWIKKGKSAWRVLDYALVVFALAAVAAVPVVMWKTGNQGFLAVELLSFRLTKQSDGIMAPNLASWVSTGGTPAALWATVLPLLVLVYTGWLMLRRPSPRYRAPLALATGPVLIALGLAWFHLRWWQMFGAALLGVIVAVTVVVGEQQTKRTWRWVWGALVSFVFLLGLIQLVPSKDAATKNVLTVSEVEGLVERDLAQWLAKHTSVEGGPVILAPPSLTSSLYFYGGLRGLGTLFWENKDGLSVALRIVISTSRDEAMALISQRGVTHIVIPSWDDFFEAYKNSSSMQTSELFFVGLDRWSLPPWLRPIPYQLPGIAGFENQSVRILEVVDEQDAPVAASRLTEYFIEMGQIENAKIAGQLLRRYPADFSVLVTRAQLEAALTDAAAFTAVFDSLLQRLSAGADRSMVWDRRISLAVVLARGKRMDLARGQVQRCLMEITEARLRSLTTYSLYHLLVMNKSLNLDIADQRLRTLALDLLPADLRTRL